MIKSIKQIKSILTKEKFTKYLSKNSNKSFVTLDSEYCAIARYLRENGVSKPSVGNSVVDFAINSKGKTMRYSLPIWARNFINKFDSLEANSKGRVSAKDSISVLINKKKA